MLLWLCLALSLGSDPKGEFLAALRFTEAADSLWVVRDAAGAGPVTSIEVVRNPKNPATEAQRLHDEQELEDAMEAMRVELRQGAPEATEQMAFLRARAASLNHLSIEFATPASLSYTIDSSVTPEVTAVPGVDALVVAVRGNAYRVEQVAGGRQQVLWREAEARVFVGTTAPPKITRRPGYDSFQVEFAAPGSPVLVATLRGNEDLITRVIDQVNWTRVRELVK